MVAAIVLAYLPADIAITDRSRNFYNGTYKWDAEGFIDEHGVRRKFDCLDPLARAPTPMPPTFSDDEEDDEQANMILEVTADTLDNDSVFRPAIAAVEPSTPCSKPTEPKSTESVTSTVSPRTPGSIRRFAIDFFANSTQRKTTPPEESEKDAKIDNAMVQKDVPASELAGTEGLDESHELSENPLTAKKEKSHVKLPETPPYSPIKAMSDAQIISPAASTTSTLSSVPSILSSVPSNLDEVGNDAGDKIKRVSTAARDTPSLSSTPTKATDGRKTKATTTRGVARKTTKNSKRAASSKSSPAKRKENSIEEFTLKELHSGAFMRKRGLRRSVRQNK